MRLIGLVAFATLLATTAVMAQPAPAVPSPSSTPVLFCLYNAKAARASSDSLLLCSPDGKSSYTTNQLYAAGYRIAHYNTVLASPGQVIHNFIFEAK